LIRVNVISETSTRLCINVEHGSCAGRAETYFLIRVPRCGGNTPGKADLSQLLQSAQVGRQVWQRQHNQLNAVIFAHLFPEIRIGGRTARYISPLLPVPSDLLAIEIDTYNSVAVKLAHLVIGAGAHPAHSEYGDGGDMSIQQLIIR
jgi:hypothetical protein